MKNLIKFLPTSMLLVSTLLACQPQRGLTQAAQSSPTPTVTPVPVVTGDSKDVSKDTQKPAGQKAADGTTPDVSKDKSPTPVVPLTPAAVAVTPPISLENNSATKDNNPNDSTKTQIPPPPPPKGGTANPVSVAEPVKVPEPGFDPVPVENSSDLSKPTITSITFKRESGVQREGIFEFNTDKNIFTLRLPLKNNYTLNIVPNDGHIFKDLRSIFEGKIKVKSKDISPDADTGAWSALEVTFSDRTSTKYPSPEAADQVNYPILFSDLENLIIEQEMLADAKPAPDVSKDDSAACKDLSTLEGVWDEKVQFNTRHTILSISQSWIHPNPKARVLLYSGSNKTVDGGYANNKSLIFMNYLYDRKSCVFSLSSSANDADKEFFKISKVILPTQTSALEITLTQCLNESCSDLSDKAPREFTRLHAADTLR